MWSCLRYIGKRINLMSLYFRNRQFRKYVKACCQVYGKSVNDMMEYGIVDKYYKALIGEELKE